MAAGIRRRSEAFFNNMNCLLASAFHPQFKLSRLHLMRFAVDKVIEKTNARINAEVVHLVGESLEDAVQSFIVLQPVLIMNFSVHLILVGTNKQQGLS